MASVSGSSIIAKVRARERAIGRWRDRGVRALRQWVPHLAEGTSENRQLQRGRVENYLAVPRGFRAGSSSR